MSFLKIFWDEQSIQVMGFLSDSLPCSSHLPSEKYIDGNKSDRNPLDGLYNFFKCSWNNISPISSLFLSDVTLVDDGCLRHPLYLSQILFFWSSSTSPHIFKKYAKKHNTKITPKVLRLGVGL